MRDVFQVQQGELLQEQLGPLQAQRSRGRPDHLGRQAPCRLRGPRSPVRLLLLDRRCQPVERRRQQRRAFLRRLHISPDDAAREADPAFWVPAGRRRRDVSHNCLQRECARDARPGAARRPHHGAARGLDDWHRHPNSLPISELGGAAEGRWLQRRQSPQPHIGTLQKLGQAFLRHYAPD